MNGWEIAKLEDQINFLEKVVKRYELSVDSLFRFDKRLVERKIDLEFKSMLGFGPATVLQIAQADIGYARNVISTYERFGGVNRL